MMPDTKKNLFSIKYIPTAKIRAIILLFLFLPVIEIVAAPAVYYEPGTVLNVLSLKGLNLRSKPNKNSKILESLSFGESVRVVSRTEKEYEVDDVKGFWVKVNYDDRIGYMFDGFLSRYPAPGASGRKNKTGFREYYQNYLDGLKNSSFTVNTPEDGITRERLVLPGIRVEEAVILSSLLTINFDKYKFSKIPIAFKSGEFDVAVTPVKDKEDNIISYEIKETHPSGNSSELKINKLEANSVEIIHLFRSP